MKLVFIRHGDPNYELDTLTSTGWEEAQIVSDRVCQMDVKAFYCSPLGRAKDTAKATLEKRDPALAAGVPCQGAPHLEGCPPCDLGYAAPGYGR